MSKPTPDPKFATCRVCGSAEMVAASTQECPGCGTPYPKEPLSTDPILLEPVNMELLEALREATWRMREALVRTPRDDLTQRELLTDAIKEADAVIAKVEAT